MDLGFGLGLGLGSGWASLLLLAHLTHQPHAPTSPTNLPHQHGMRPAAAAAAAEDVPWRCAEAFNFFDFNRSGYLDVGELQAALKYYGICHVSSQEAKRLLHAYDDTPDGKLDMREFVAL